MRVLLYMCGACVLVRIFICRCICMQNLMFTACLCACRLKKIRDEGGPG